MNFPPCLIAVLLPLVAAATDGDGMSPAEYLRCLGEGGNSQREVSLRLTTSPEALLDVIFLVRGTDDPDPKTTATARQWIRKLGHERYAEREEASEFLHGMGTGARLALEEAEKDVEPEIRMRVELLLSALKSQPALKDLDYGMVHEGVEKIVAGMKEEDALKTLAEGAIRRMGTPTVHSSEAWLLRPVFRELVKRDFKGAGKLVVRALESSHEELAASAAAAISEETSSKGLSEIHITALSLRRPECLDALLHHASSVDEKAAITPRYREALLSISGERSLPESARLKAQRLLLIGFREVDSLRALIDAGLAGEERICALALSDPRLAGVALAGSERAAALIEHPLAEVREAAGIFLLSRPEAAQQRSGLAFLPHLSEAGETSLKLLLGSMREPKVLREELGKRVDRRDDGWEKAERLMFSLPGESEQSPLGIPFGFR